MSIIKNEGEPVIDRETLEEVQRQLDSLPRDRFTYHVSDPTKRDQLFQKRNAIMTERLKAETPRI